MTQAEINNALKYTLLALAAFSIGCASALVPQLMDPAMPALNWRVVLGTGITALITAYGGAMLPRLGSTGIAAQVNNLKAQGVARSEMVVLPEATASAALANQPAVLPSPMRLSDEDVDRIARRGIAVMRSEDRLKRMQEASQG